MALMSARAAIWVRVARVVELAHLDGRAAPQGRQPFAASHRPWARRRASSVIALTARPHSPRSIKRSAKTSIASSLPANPQVSASA